MKQFAHLWLLTAFCALAPFYIPFGSKISAAPKGGEKTDLEELIRKLSDNRYPVREMATRNLIDRKDAPPALRKALPSAELEVSRRIALILKAHEEREEREALARMKRFANRGEVGRVIELFARCPKWADEEAGFQVMTEVAARLVEAARKEFGEVVPPPDSCLPVGNFRNFTQRVRPILRAARHLALDIRKDPGEASVARGQEITLVGTRHRNLLISSGPVSMAFPGSQLLSCVVFSTGSVVLDGLTNSVILCDGDVTAGRITNSLIVARGQVRCDGSVTNSRIITCSSVRAFTVRDSLIQEGQPMPLGFVKFFDPDREGVAVEPAEGSVRVKDADAAKPFAKAGLRKGDLIASLGGEPVASPEVFRRALRAKMAVGENMLFRVRREGLSVEVSVPAPR